MTDSQVSELCQQIYQKHRRALDRIFEEVKSASQQEFVRGVLEELIERDEMLVFDSSSKGVVRFAARTWASELGLM